MGLFDSLPRNLTDALTALAKAARDLCEAKTNEILHRGRAELATKSDLKEMEIRIMAKVSQLEALLEPVVTGLSEVGAQLEKARVEIVKAITDNDPEVPEAVLAKVNQLATIGLALKGAAQALDDLNTDAPAAG